MSETADRPAAVMQDQTDHLCHALLESRRRWREFGAIAVDLAFETDCQGRLTFVAPDTVLGWPATTLLGRPAADLLAEHRATLPDPFRFNLPIRQRRTWMRRADGDAACLSITSVPLLDLAGQFRGLRGVGVDVTQREQQDEATAAALRRGEALDHIMGQMRQEVLAPRMMQAVLESLMRALGGQGAAVLDLLQPSGLSPVLHHAGASLEPVMANALTMLRREGEDTASGCTPCGRHILTSPASTRFGERAGLVVWRAASNRPWDAEDMILASSVTGVIRIVLEHEAIQRELARQARTDPLTGLLNRRAFLEEAGRRIDRLDRDAQPGILMFIDLDRLKPLNDRLGHEAGDNALMLTGALLRRLVRPMDLVARLGGDEFAVWMDSTDELTAAERADELCRSVPLEMAHLTAGEEIGMTVSVGIACRQSSSFEEIDRLIQRADQAMYEVKRTGGGHWLVSRAERLP